MLDNKIIGSRRILKEILVHEIKYLLKFVINKITWFNDVENFWIVARSVDGAPETTFYGMTLGCLQILNINEEINKKENVLLQWAADIKETSPIVVDIIKEDEIDRLDLAYHGVVIDEVKHTFDFVEKGDQKWAALLKGQTGQSFRRSTPYNNVQNSKMINLETEVIFFSKKSNK